MSREVLTEQDIQQAFKEYCEGASIHDVAQKYYVCTRTLERMFSRRKLRKSVGYKSPKK